MPHKQNRELKYGFTFLENPKEYNRVDSQARREADPIRYLLNQTRYRAKQRGWEFDLTLEELVVPTHCPVFKIPLFYTKGGRTPNSYSLDRLDNSKGYTKENTRVISFKANQYKGDMSIEEVQSLLDYMKGNTP